MAGEVDQNSIAQLLDQCASDYGWSIRHILSHTYHQLKGLGSQAEKRKRREYETLAGVFRMAQHADKHEYSRFVRGLSQPDDTSRRKTIISQQDAPHGIRVKKE